MKKINLKFDINIKLVFFFISFIFFIYLLYLSIPSLYDTGRVQKDISEKLDKDFNLKFSLSTDISYRILPKPHFVIRDCELIQLESNVSNRVAEIQNLKIFIKQSNFFDKEINIKDLRITNANFFLNKPNINFIRNFLDKKFSPNLIKISKSKIFFKDNNDELIFIYSIKDFRSKYHKDNNKNVLSMDGEIFNINNKVNWNKDFDSKKKITKISAKKIFLNFKNEAQYINNIYEYTNTLEIQSNKFKTNYKLNQNKISFFSEKSLIKNTLIDYEGNIDLNPFNFIININSKKINLNYFFNNLELFHEILVSRILFKKNLFGKIKINTDKISKSKIFNSANINIDFQGGSINLDDTIFTSDNLGELKITNSRFFVNNENLLFEGVSKLSIKNLSNFYKIFLTPKKNRLNLKSIDFYFEINPKTGIFKIKKILLYDEKQKIIDTKFTKEILNEKTNNEFSYLNPIQFKNFLNEILIAYSYEG